MYRKRKKLKIRIVFITVVSFLLIAVTCASSLAIRKTVSGYAKDQATTILFNAANEAVGEYLAQNGVTYNEIVRLTRNSAGDISSLEIDVVKINELKSGITNMIANGTALRDFYEIGIPIGTLFGNEYTLGLGPQLKFKMQMVSTVLTDFESNFYSAGINQVLHQILIKVKISGNVIIPWCKTPFELETSVIAAQTVLVGVTPEAYTNVIESYSYGEDGVVGDLFDYGAILD